MKQILILLLLIVVFTVVSTEVAAQCSICTRTASQLGEKPARGINTGILYLAATPMLVVGVIAFNWWRRNGRVQS